jgi:hypothetical protein
MGSIVLEFNDFDTHSLIHIPAVSFKMIGIGLDGITKFRYFSKT